MGNVYFYAAFIIIIAYSIILHEMAHAVAALWSGDETAKLANRITLNPIPHIDPFGTILLPGILLLTSVLIRGAAPMVIFGWAKPVPVNPYRFRNLVKGDIFVSSAGVIMNLILAYFFILLLHLTQPGYWNARVFFYGAAINITLAIFNLVPIPPLDGSHLFKYLLPREMRARYENIGMAGFFLVFLFLMFAGDLLDTAIMGVFRVLAFLGGHGW